MSARLVRKPVGMAVVALIALPGARPGSGDSPLPDCSAGKPYCYETPVHLDSPINTPGFEGKQRVAQHRFLSISIKDRTDRTDRTNPTDKGISGVRGRALRETIRDRQSPPLGADRKRPIAKCEKSWETL